MHSAPFYMQTPPLFQKTTSSYSLQSKAKRMIFPLDNFDENGIRISCQTRTGKLLGARPSGGTLFEEPASEFSFEDRSCSRR